MLSMFENRVLSKIFGPKREQATMEWTKRGAFMISIAYQILFGR
jgi:hypothetical protein